MKKLEHQLRRLSVRPSLLFRLKLSFKLWRAGRPEEKLPIFKIGLSFAAIILFISAAAIYNYRQSYAYYLNLAKRDTVTLEKLLNGRPEASGFLIKKALALSSLDEEAIVDLSQKIVANTQLALEKIDDIVNLEKIKVALREVENLHEKEIEVFAKAVEKVDQDQTAAKIIRAIEVTNQDIRKVKKVVSQVAILKNATWLPVRLKIDLQPTRPESGRLAPQPQTPDVNSPQDIAAAQVETLVKTNQAQAIVEQKLADFIITKQPQPLVKQPTRQTKTINEPTPTISNEPTKAIEDVSEHYLKARKYIEAGQYNKAYGLMTAAEAQTQFINQPSEKKDTNQDPQSSVPDKTPIPEEKKPTVEPIPPTPPALIVPVPTPIEDKNIEPAPSVIVPNPLPEEPTKDQPAVMDSVKPAVPVLPESVKPQEIATPDLLPEAATSAIEEVKAILEKEGKLIPNTEENQNQASNPPVEKLPTSTPEQKDRNSNTPIIDAPALPSSENPENKPPRVDDPKIDNPTNKPEPSIPEESSKNQPTPVQPADPKDKTNSPIIESKKPEETPPVILPQNTQFIAPPTKTPPKKQTR